MPNIGAPQTPCNQSSLNRLPLVRAYRAQGWTHLHPILPPLAAPEGLDEKAAKTWALWHSGKCPGVMDGWGRWYPVGVQRAGFYDELADETHRLHHEARRAWGNGAGIGVLGRVWPAIDVDVVELAQADAVARLLRQRFGSGCFLRVGRWPKFLVPFRLGDDLMGLRKMRIDAGTAGVVEVLASGQQWVLEGMHGGAGRPYAWQPQEAAGQARRPVPGEMPVLGLHALEDLLRALARVLGVTGKVKVQTQHALPVRPADELAGPEELCTDILRAWKNDREVGRDTWVGVGHALMGASSWGQDWDGRALFNRWSRRHPKHDTAADERLWSSVKETRLGVEWLVAKVPGVTAGDQVGWLARLSTWRMQQADLAETAKRETAGETV